MNTPPPPPTNNCYLRITFDTAEVYQYITHLIVGGQDCMLVPLHMQANTNTNKPMRVSPFRSGGAYGRHMLG